MNVVKNTTNLKNDVTSTSLLLAVSFTLPVDNPRNTMNAYQLNQALAGPLNQTRREEDPGPACHRST